MFYRFISCFCLIGCCVLSVHGRTDKELKTWFMQQGIDCNKDHPLSPEEMQVLHKNRMPDSKVAKCLMACIFRKTNMMDTKGKFDMEETHAIAKKEYLDNPEKLENSQKLIDMCKKVNDEAVTDGEDGCERAHQLFECFVNNAPQMGFDI